MNIFDSIKRQCQLLTIRTVALMANTLTKRKQEYDVLLVKVDAIGDFVLWLNAFWAFEKKYAGKKMAIVCNKHVEEIVRNIPGVSKIFTVKKHMRLGSLYRWAWELRKYHFKEVINPVFSRTYSMDQLIRLVNADSKIGFDCDLSNMSAKDMKNCNTFYNKLIKDESKGNSELLRNADFARQVCDPAFTASLPVIPLPSAYTPINIPQPYCVFSLGAGSRQRCWDVQNFVEVASIIPDSVGIVLVGVGEREVRLSEEFKQSVAKERRIYDFTNQTSLTELLCTIKSAQFVVGNDSSHVHISAALRTPSICIAGGGHWGRFIPYAQEIPEQFYHPRIVNKFMDCYGCNWRCIYPLQQGQWKCVADAPVESVKEELNKLMQTLRLA